MPNPVLLLSKPEARVAVNDVTDTYGFATSDRFRRVRTAHPRRLPAPFAENAGPVLIACNLPEGKRAELLAAMKIAGLDVPLLWIMDDRASGPGTEGPGQRGGNLSLTGSTPRIFPDGGSHPIMDARPIDQPSRVCGWEQLSKRERGIAYLTSEALTNRQIAHRVFLSPHTVNYHLRQIFRKLGINSRVELASLARTHLSEEMARHEP